MRRIMGIGVAVMLAMAAACGDGKNPIEVESIAGTYQLQTVNDRSLPWTAFEGPGFKYEMVSGSFTFTNDGKYTSTGSLRLTENGVVSNQTETGFGTYVVAGTSVTMTESDGEKFSGTVQSSVFTLTDEGFTFVFRK